MIGQALGSEELARRLHILAESSVSVADLFSDWADQLGRDSELADVFRAVARSHKELAAKATEDVPDPRGEAA